MSNLTSPSNVPHKETNDTDNKKVTATGMKKLWQKYGYIAVGTYLGVYVSTLSAVFVALEFDIFQASQVGFDPVDAVNIVRHLEYKIILTDYKLFYVQAANKFEYFTGSKALPEFIKGHPTFGTFVVAWVMTKFTEPLRLAATIFAVPKIAKFFRPEKPKYLTPFQWQNYINLIHLFTMKI